MYRILVLFLAACGELELGSDTAESVDTAAPVDTAVSVDTATGVEPGYDYDLDGFSDVTGFDCDDFDASVNPGAIEVCNDVDDDCDGSVDEGLATVSYYVDADGDGYGAGSAIELCAVPILGYSDVDGDCNDADASTHPGAEDAPDDGVDSDCDDEVEESSSSDVDVDGDGYTG